MDVGQYIEIFINETKEHLQSLNTQILELEQDPENMDTINEIFRAAHTLKGMAGTMGYKKMQTLTHDTENVFSEVRNGHIKVTASMIDVLFQCLDALEEYLANIQNSGDEGENDNEHLIRALNDILENKSEDAGEASQTPADAAGEEASVGEKKWGEIPLAESELHVMREAVKQGKNLVGITVHVQESCILKAARAFLVFKSLEELGEIIVSNPPVQDIEDEKFEFDFSLILVTEAEAEEAVKAAAGVSEIESVQGEIISLPEAGDRTEEATEDLAEGCGEEQKQAEEEPAVQEVRTEKEAAPAMPAAPAAPAAKENKPAETKKGKPVVNRTVRVDIEKLDVLMNLVSELIIAKNSLVSATNAEEASITAVNEQIEYLESVTTNLHESVMKVRMVPIESVVNKFPRMIRDLQKQLGKKMELYMSGEETELDRTVVDEIGDPLMHLLRNSADHGLESAEVRRERGKSEVGSIFLNAFQEGNNVVIEVSDDGNGIDVDAVRAKAIDRGTITEEQASMMSEKEIIDLLFLPSFSTAKVVSDVSGRGVGLDVVRSKIQSLSGEVEVKSRLGEGSTWTIRLPLTLAIIQALMVEVGGEKYAISLGAIQTIEDISPDDIKLVESKEVIHLRGSVIPLVRLNEVLDIASTRAPEDNLVAVIVKKGDKLAGLIIDNLMGQQEIVIKSLGKYVNKNKEISGATILGDGEVALILDTNALL
ncbi:MAG: chemotaxis protein CheA [Lachnospiraceae bacterium]|nr:chemotaxis protein CheA [Lachnospiraceae bacterium]